MPNKHKGLQAEISALQIKLRDLQTFKEELLAQHRALQIRHDALNEELSHKADAAPAPDIEREMAILKAASDRVHHRETELTRHELALARKESDMRAAQQELEQGLLDKDNEIREIRETMHQLEATLSAKKSEMSTIKDQLIHHQEVIHALEAEALAKIEAHKAELSEATKGHESVLLSLQALQEELTAVEAQKDALSLRLEDTEGINKGLRYALSAKTDEALSAEARATAIEKRSTILHTKLTEALRAKQQLAETGQARVEELSKALSLAQEEVRRIHDKAVELRIDLDCATRTMEELNSNALLMSKQLSTAKKSIAASEVTIGDLTGQLAAAQNRGRDLEGQLETAHSRISDLEATAESAAQASAARDADFKALEEERDGLRSALEAAQARPQAATVASSDHAKLQAQYDSLMEAHKLLLVALATGQMATPVVQRSIDAVHSGLAGSRSTLFGGRTLSSHASTASDLGSVASAASGMSIQ
jgi:chromosome segregation ATPase